MKILSKNVELNNEINSKERLTTVLVKLLEHYSIMILNTVENSQEKEEDLEKNFEKLSVEIEDKDNIIRNLIVKAVKLSKN